MSVFAVMVDFDRLGNNYTSVRKKMTSLGALQAQGTVWLVRYDNGADALRDYLQNDLGQNDRLFVAALSGDWAAFNMTSSSRWLKEASLSSRP